MGRTGRCVAVGTAALGSAAVSVLFAVPAEACGCSQGSPKVALDRGGTVVIVTRTDDTPNDAPGRGLPVGTFRVESFAGPEQPPAVLHGRMDTGASCAPYVVPGALAALSAGRGDDGEWTVGGCGRGYALGPAMQLTEGDPEAEPGGRPVAYAAGDFGSGRVAALDAEGDVVAWDRTPGHGTTVAVCPGGDTVVVADRPPIVPPDRDPTRPAELTVHDALDLTVRRTVTFSIERGERVFALRCLDADGAKIDLLASTRDNHIDRDGRLLRVRGNEVRTTQIPGLAGAQAVPDGFLLQFEGKTTKFVRLRPDGIRVPVAKVHGFNGSWTVSPYGRTLAALGSLDGRGAVLSFDTATGELLGKAPPPQYVSGMAWTASGELLVRQASEYREPTNRVHAYSRTLKKLPGWQRVPGEWAGPFGALGDTAIVYGPGSRLTATPRSGAPLVAGSNRLAAAEQVVPAYEDAEFAAAPPAAAPGAAAPRTLLADDASTSGPSTGAVAAGAVGAGAAAGLLGAAFALRRRRRGSSGPAS